MHGLRVQVFVGGVCLALLGCASSVKIESRDAGDAVVISGIAIRNQLPYTVTDVMIEVPETGNFAGCGTILPGAVCRNRFQQLDYRDNAVVIRWREHGEAQQTDEFRIQLPEHARAGAEYLIEVIVFAPAQAGARLVEAEAETVRTR